MSQTEFNLEAVRNQTLQELERKIEERKQLDKEISGLRVALNGFNATIEAMQNKYKLEPPPLDGEYAGLRKLGLTDAVRLILQHAPGGMSPKDVRDKLESLEYKLPKQNPLAAIHGIFTRLRKMYEIEPTQPDQKAFRWVPAIERLSKESRQKIYQAVGQVLSGTAVTDPSGSVPPVRTLSRRQRY